MKNNDKTRVYFIAILALSINSVSANEKQDTLILSQQLQEKNHQTETRIVSNSFTETDRYRQKEFEQSLSLVFAELQRQRVVYRRYFNDAYQTFPQIPKGFLEAIAFSASRWSHQNITQNDEYDPNFAHRERPRAYGIMGLYHGSQYFTDVAQLAANALNVEIDLVLNDPRINIKSTAALIDRYITKLGLINPSVEDLKPVLELISGIKQEKHHTQSKISLYAIESYIYDIMLILHQGVDDNGVQIDKQNIDWHKVFDLNTLVKLKAPVINIDLDNDQVTIPHYRFNPINEQLEILSSSSKILQDSINHQTSNKKLAIQRSTDYSPALYEQSPYDGSRQGNSVSAITIHTAQGSYSGTINWFKNNPYSVSAHYVIRSLDGQITQMVREYRKSNHVGIHNLYTIGIEHEGYVSNPAWYTSAMYDSSANLVKNICAKYSQVDCASAYNGAPSSNVDVLPTGIKIKGHQHFSSQTHTDPGVYWNWASYYARLNGADSPNNKILDSFESNEGHFNLPPTYSGSTKGIAPTSTATRTNAISASGSFSEQIKFVDDSTTAVNWSVRFLSGSGNPNNNESLSKAGGRVGFWVYSGGSDINAAIAVDDSDGTERTNTKPIPPGQWTYLEWKLDDSNEWNPWVGGNGIISSTSITLDSIWFFRTQTNYNVYLYLDDVQYRFEG